MTSLLDRDEFSARLFFPRRDTSVARDAVDHVVGPDAVHVRVHAASGATRGTILVFHGNGEVVADYDRARADFARIGARLAVAEYRGYGASGGVPSLRGVIDDARPIAAAVQAEIGDAPLVVMGRSLGGVAAHELYAHPIAGLVGVVLESALFDLDALTRRRGLVPPTWTADELATFAPAGKLARGRLPLLVLPGADDARIVPAEATAAHAAAGGSAKQLVFVPGRGHNDLSFSAVYWDALEAFFASTLSTIDRAIG
ncbi:MAG: alpha/beta hydrolase [Proteobacteria bacterium]|nr:alpha/beta hydrolase [Pseudomonadota bacterium]